MEFVQYQLETMMGDGSWAGVYQTEEEASSTERAYLSFPTKEAARAYANAAPPERGWAGDPLARGVVRIVVVRTTRTVVE